MKVSMFRSGMLSIVCLGLLGILTACDQSGSAPKADAPDSAESARTADPGAREGGLPCAPGTKCLKVNSDGTPNPSGTSIAQCSEGASFPDYIVPASYFPENYQGPWFAGAMDFPQDEPDLGPLPWEEIDFWEGQEQADAYIYALRDYSFEGNIEVDFRVQENPIRPWYTIPYMNYGPGRRELVHGLTKERSVTGPELGLKPGVTIENYAIGFYNAGGGYTAGQVWQAITQPDLSKAMMQDGTMVFKILFTTATADDFANPDEYPLNGAPEWQIATGSGELTTVRLMQMDVAVRDARAEVNGWVFGTFAFDGDAEDPIAWNRLRPVGIQWGNAPGYTPADQEAGKPLPENIVSDEIPSYAAAHLGWAGRVNGPVDNPVSACMSCHATAQYPVDAAMAPFSSNCDTDEKKLQWFENNPAEHAFGFIDSDTCLRGETPDPPPVSLDLSLQMQVSVQSILQYNDVNPCVDAPDAGRTAAPSAMRSTNAPRTLRGGDAD